MDIRFHDHEASRQAALCMHARQRLQHRLAHRSERIHHVEVRLGGTGSRRGHQDIYCLMRLQTVGAPATTVVDIGTDAFDTIDRAADRVARMADEQLRLADRDSAKHGKEKLR